MSTPQPTATQLDPILRYFYDAWLQEQTRARGFDPSGTDYDMPGYYLSGGWLDPPGTGHFPDTYKQPNHPTFSDESVYHMTPNGGGGLNLGGHWYGETFVPNPGQPPSPDPRRLGFGLSSMTLPER